MENQTNFDLESKGHQLEVSMARFIRTKDMKVSDGEFSIADIIDIEDLKEIMEPFYETTGLGVGLFDNKNKLLVSAGWQKICTHFHQKHPEASSSCAESANYFTKNFEPNKAISYKCKNGLWDMAYPIYVDDDFLGSINFGQFFFDNEKIDRDFFVNQATKYNFDQEEYLGQLRNVPILGADKINAYIKLFVTIIEKISKIGKL